MKHALKALAAAAGLLLALAGCAQHGMGMRAGMMGADADGGSRMGPAMMRGDAAAPGHPGHGPAIPDLTPQQREQWRSRPGSR